MFDPRTTSSRKQSSKFGSAITTIEQPFSFGTKGLEIFFLFLCSTNHTFANKIYHQNLQSLSPLHSHEVDPGFTTIQLEEVDHLEEVRRIFFFFFFFDDESNLAVSLEIDGESSRPGNPRGGSID